MVQHAPKMANFVSWRGCYLYILRNIWEKMCFFSLLQNNGILWVYYKYILEYIKYILIILS
jgi:hypothetical protein